MRNIVFIFLLVFASSKPILAQMPKSEIFKYIRLGDVEKAHDLFTTFGPPYKDLGKSYLGMATYLGQAYQRKLLKMAYKENPNDWRITIKYAIALLETDLEKSEELFYKAITNGLSPLDCPPLHPGEMSSCFPWNDDYQQYTRPYWFQNKDIDKQITFLKRNIELFPDKLSLQYELSNFLYENGDFDEALKYAKNVSLKYVDNYAAQFLYLRYLYDLGHTEKLFSEIPRILKIEDLEFHRLNGGELTNFVLFSEENKETEELLLRLTETYPTNPYVQMSYGIFLEYKGQQEEAESYYRKSIPLMDGFYELTDEFLDNSRFSKGLRISPELRKIYVGKSRQIVNRYIDDLFGMIVYNPHQIVTLDGFFEGMSETRIQKLYNLEKNKPEVTPILFFVFSRYYESRNIEKTIEIHKNGVAKFPNDYRLYNNYLQFVSSLEASQRRLLNIDLGELKKNLFSISPKRYDTPSYINLIEFTDEELQSLHKMRLSLHGNNFYSYRHYANFLKRIGLIEEAKIILSDGENVLREQLAENPQNYELIESFADVLIENGKPKETIDQLKKLTKLESPLPNGIAYRIGDYADSLILLRNWQGMIEAYIDHLISWENTRDAWSDYYLLKENKVVEELILNNEITGIEQLIVDAVNDRPNLPHPYGAYGVYLMKKGRLEDANKMFNKGYEDQYLLLEYLREKYYKQMNEGNIDNVKTLKFVIQKIIDIK